MKLLSLFLYEGYFQVSSAKSVWSKRVKHLYQKVDGSVNDAFVKINFNPDIIKEFVLDSG